MQPVVLVQFAAQHVLVPERFVLDFRIAQRQGDGIVPNLLVLGRVHGNFRRLLQQNHIHIARFDFSINLRGGTGVDHRKSHSTHPQLFFHFRVKIDQKRAAAIVQQPLDIDTTIERPKRHAIGFQVVGLLQIHVNQYFLSMCCRNRAKNHENKGDYFENFAAHENPGLSAVSR